MKISNVRVYGLAESIVASGYPMLAEPMESIDFLENCMAVEIAIREGDYSNKHIQRTIRLANAPAGSGHDCAIKGILVQMDVNAPQYFWQQLQRYHFVDFVSSMSKMHCITKFAHSNSMFDGYTTQLSVDAFEQTMFDHEDGKADIDEVLCNVPMGLEYTARMTTNFLQLKTIYKQRRTHRSRQWQEFCDWIESLPMAKELITGGEKNEL